MKQPITDIINELQLLSALIDQRQLHVLCDRLYSALEAKHPVFLAGVGRSGCVARGFANRLMHLGYTCYVIGEMVTPPVKANDIVFIISGSGRTSSLVNIARKARALQADILTITLHNDSEIAGLASAFVLLSGTDRYQMSLSYESVQPVGSCFEQLSWITCDAIIMELKERLHICNDAMLAHHANLE